MIETKIILLDNAELVKRIEDNTSSVKSIVHHKEKDNITKSKVYWHRFKKN